LCPETHQSDSTEDNFEVPQRSLPSCLDAELATSITMFDATTGHMHGVSLPPGFMYSTMAKEMKKTLQEVASNHCIPELP